MRIDIFEKVNMIKANEEKINYAEIGRVYNCDPRTVKKYFERDQTKPTRKSRTIIKVTDGFEEIIRKKVLENKASAIGVFDVLVKKYGYKGSYSSIKNIVHGIKEQEKKEIRIRFETIPGQQAQIDWKESFKIYNRKGEEYIINIFLAILGYSRKKYIELTIDREQKTLFKCLCNMFMFYGGVPQELLFDNMKTVVDRPKTQFGNVVLNTKFYEFSKDIGFRPITCLPYSPWTKGKVEVVAKLMDRLYAYNNEFDTLDELNEIIIELRNSINNEVSRTTKEKPNVRFEKEKEYLNPISNQQLINDYISGSPQIRKVSRESMIEYNGCKYSVPQNYIKKNVEIKVENGKIRIIYQGACIRTHIISNKPINYYPQDYFDIASKTYVKNENIEEMCKMNLENFDKLFGE